mmetsp:Transcript_148157/g.475864  ORF Transcript_148157/g.475864 Transcript_148157/m.475864 type:complete len:232 (-) Transcript_148157:1757-2452(-)
MSASKNLSAPLFAGDVGSSAPWPAAASAGLWGCCAMSISSKCFSRTCLCTNSGPRNSLRQTTHRNFASPTACVWLSQNSWISFWSASSLPAGLPPRVAPPPPRRATAASRRRTRASSSWRTLRKRTTSSSARRFSASARRSCSAFGVLPPIPPKCKPLFSILLCSSCKSIPLDFAICSTFTMTACMAGRAAGFCTRQAFVSSARSASISSGNFGSCPLSLTRGNCIWLTSE